MAGKQMDIVVEIGAGFTDGIFAKDGEIVTTKVETPSNDPGAALMDCLEEGAGLFQQSLPDMLSGTNSIRYSTTQPEDILRRRSGCRVGLIVTHGCEATLYGDREDPASLDVLVPKELIVTVDEEVDASGRVVRGVKEEGVFEITKYLLERGAEAIAICLRNAYCNPANERLVKQIIDQEFPKFYLGAVRTLCSHAVCGRRDDHLRVHTTVINLYLHKDVAKSVHKAESNLRFSRFARPLLVMQGTGGLARAAKTRPTDMYKAGAVAGLLGTAYVGRLCGLQKWVAVDMGSTSIDVGIATNGELEVGLDARVAGFPVETPLVNVRSIGLGGNSTACVEDGKVRLARRGVGPVPVPVSCDAGGTEPTVTDANLVLGYLSADGFSGGKRKLDPEKARKAIKEKIADPLGMTTEEAAFAIKGAIEDSAGQAITDELALRGFAPDDVALLAYGGAAGAHCAGCADRAGISKVIVPRLSSVFCAFGEAVAGNHRRYTEAAPLTLYERGRKRFLEEFSSFNSTVRRLMEKGSRDLQGEGFSQDQVRFSLDLIVRQSEGPDRVLKVPKLRIDSKQEVEELCDSVRASDPTEGDRSIELVSVIVTVHCPFECLELPKQACGKPDPDPALKGTRNVYWEGGWKETAVFSRDDLKSGNRVEGPAVIEHAFGTCAIPAGKKMTFDEYRNGIIESC